MVSMAKNFSMPCCFMVFALTFVPAFHGVAALVMATMMIAI